MNYLKILLTFLLTTLLIISTFSAQAIPLTRPNSNTSTWYWDEFDKEDYKTKIDKAISRGVNNIYLNMIGVTIQSPSTIEKFKSNTNLMLDYANKRGITIEALYGRADAANPENVYKVYNILDFVLKQNTENINKGLPRFSGFSIDIEFYTLSYYQKSKSYLAKNYLDMVKRIAAKINIYRETYHSNFVFSQASPFFLTDTGFFPSQFYDRKYSPFHETLNFIIEDSKFNKVILMAYRNNATGPNSVTDISKPFISYLYNTGSLAKVIIAVETANVYDSFISMYGNSINQISHKVNQIDNIYNANPNYDSAAMHDINSLINTY
ncbi:MAG: hypothetical protein ACRCXZ_00990 [Patescibacteria group bacterium]